ncbi:MAG: type VI secretion system baseplate subunit TssG [Holosporaceae bacterium]|jgi:predicted component of type VI protein secretion system|nr:type VI secretion system baseplate subunit TssG [Holosporaceae bacterium]
METTIRNQKLPLNEELLARPRQFSFEMAAYVLEFGSQTSFGKEISLSTAPFRTKSLNSFHLRGTEIEKITTEDNRRVIYIERLSISGLNAPLPTPYAELIFRQTQKEDYAMGEFINSFNTRLLGISYQISKRRYLNLQSSDRMPLLKVIATFFGKFQESIDKKMARLSYLFWTKEKSAAGLEAAISAFFGFTTQVREIQTFWTNRQEIHPLENMKLGVTSELGKRVSLSSFGVEINLTHDNYKKIFQLLFDQQYMNDLKLLIYAYLGDFFHFTLSFTPHNIPPLKMSETLLGKTSWISGKTFDSSKIIC